MAIKTLLLILASALLTVTTAAQDYRPAENDLSWGDHSRGLRMAVWTNPETNYVSTVIRNFAPQKISYSEGVDANIHIYARRDAASKWRHIKLKPVESREVIAIMNCPTIEPNEEDEVIGLNLHEYDFPADWNGLIEVRVFRFLNITKKVCDRAGRITKVKSRAFKVNLPLTKATTQK